MTELRFPCPCCGYLTFLHEPDGTYEICPVCRWEDDPVQLNDPDFSGGANEPSLNQARENFRKLGAKHQDSVVFARAPTAEEKPN